jgi:hypothetical protein
MSAERETADLLGRCLAIRLDAGELAGLRAQLLSSPSMWSELMKLALQEGLVQAVHDSLRARRLLPSQFLPAHLHPRAPDSGFVAVAESHAQRRAALTGHLRDIIARLNRIGVEPIVIKGAQSLLTGEPTWRYLADFDFLIPDRAEDAQAELLALGFQEAEEQQERRRRHHLPPLVRTDFPGFIEVHRRAGNQYARPLLPTEELAQASVAYAQDGVRFRLLPYPLHVLYGLVHHHVGHSGDARGSLSLKGLYEFAWDVSRMGEADRSALKTRADRHPRVSAALDMWLAGAAAQYRLPVERPLAIHGDAVRKWEGTLARIGRPRPWYKYPGYADELRMGLAEGRVRAAPGGANPLGRLWLRAKVVRSFLPRLVR